MNYWVINGAEYIAEILINDREIILKNGLVTRTIQTEKCETTSWQNTVKNIEYIDSPYCDVQVSLNNVMMPISGNFKFLKAKLTDCLKTIEFNPTDTMTEVREYPPKGKAVELIYDNGDLGVRVRVHYEIYDEIPTIMKQVFIDNYGAENLVVDDIKVDIMNITKHRDRIFIESNYNALTNVSTQSFNEYGKYYFRYVYEKLEIGTLNKINACVPRNCTHCSIITYEISLTADYHEQKLIEVKTVYRYIMPWTNDSVLFFHLIANSSKSIRKAVDQCVEVGAEMIIQSFGSGVNMESENGKYLQRIKEDYDYAHSKGIRIGAYTLAYVKNYSPVRGHEAINHDSTHICRCLATDWAKGYIAKILNFIDKTGADAIEIDGPYGMQLCGGGKTHLHKDFYDSQYLQWKMSVDDWYKELKKRNVYINAPDWHFLNGTNRCPVGYEEIAFSERRQEQLLVSRIYYYKGTFVKNPAMSWGFVPLNQYHGGGKQATFFPISKNAFDFDWAIAQIVASGIWPTLRGVKIYDSLEGKEILTKWIAIYKKYRQVLNGITVHFMPPRIDKKNPIRTTGIDAIMNQLPYGEVRGFVMFFNQTDTPITQKIIVPTYYTGLTDLLMPPAPFPNTNSCDVEYPVYGEEIAPLVIKNRKNKGSHFVKDDPIADSEILPLPQATNTDKFITVSREDQDPKTYCIDSNGNIEMEITLPSMSYQWYVMRPCEK